MTLIMPNPQSGLNEHWLTFDEFVRLADQGAFGPSQHLELIDGRIIDLAPIGNEHGSGSVDVTYALRRALEAAGLYGRYKVWGAVTLRISKTRAPQPDALIARPTSEQWVTPQVTELVIEIAVTSQDYDLRTKPSIYAAAGISEYWVVDRAGGKVHVFREPEGGSYSETYGPVFAGQSLSPLFAPDIAIPVADLL